MCSSPRGSSQRLRQTKRKELSRSDYQEYARMIERASAVYDRIEQEKTENRRLIPNLTATNNTEEKPLLKKQDKDQTGLLSVIKSFLLQAVF